MARALIGLAEEMEGSPTLPVPGTVGEVARGFELWPAIH